ncbi:MAG: hypothetical protein K8R21_04975, partial [Leptospira sp.]|nr:hypothetical protein [Leptospira sp.]
QMGIADRMNRDLRFFDSLTHYRIAKDYGISILSDLKNTEEEKKAILSKYQVDLSDNRNMVFRQANSKEPAKK